MRLNNPQVRKVLEEQMLQFASFAPPAPDNNYFMTSSALTGGENAVTSLLAASMSKSVVAVWPLVPVLVVTDNADNDWTAVSAKLVGIDQFGNRIAETVACSNATGTWTGTAVNAYASLVSITITVTGTVVATSGSEDTYILGFVQTYGIGMKPNAAADLLISNFDGAEDEGTLSLSYYTYVVAGTPDASKLLTFYGRSRGY